MKLWVSSLLFLHIVLVVPSHADDTGRFRMLNSYLALKLHLGASPEEGKLVGAAWLRFRNDTGADVSNIPLLLNPGMKISRVVGPKNAELALNQKIAAVADWPELELTQASARLQKPLKDGNDIELTIYYEGSMTPLAKSGMGYVRESLAPDFTIFRFENFGFPVVAPAGQTALAAAGRQQQFQQSITLELPEGYVPAGNVAVQQKTLKGDRIEFELKSEKPVEALVLPIARYGQLSDGAITVNYLGKDRANAERLAAEAKRTMALFTDWFGPCPDSRGLVITAIPEGYGSQRLPGFILQDEAAFKSAENYVELYHEIAHLWHPREASLKPSRWNEGLAMLMQAMADDALQGKTGLASFKNTRFNRVREMFSQHADQGAIPMADYGTRDVTDLSYSVGAVFFATLDDLMGREKFLQLIRALQTDFATTGADTYTYVDYLIEQVPGRKTKAFVEGWFLEGKAGADIVGAKDYAALIKKYR